MSSNLATGLEMYFSPDVARKFAELEQNEKNFAVARIVDTILVQESTQMSPPLRVAELGGGAHPDRYDQFFGKLIREGGSIDWVDIAPIMLELARDYIADEKFTDRRNIITFVENDILSYLDALSDEKLDLAIMKYTIDHVDNLERLFQLLSKKLAPDGRMIATIGSTSSELKSYSTNARFLYNGESFPDNETRTLKDGDNFTVRFFKVSGDPQGGYLDGAETIKYFHSASKIERLAAAFGFDIFLGDWKQFATEVDQTLDQDILVLTKR